MTILLNGTPYEIPGPMSVADLLARLELEPQRVAVEHNLVVLKRAVYERAILAEGDQIEIVNVVGGGESSRRRHACRPGPRTLD